MENDYIAKDEIGLCNITPLGMKCIFEDENCTMCAAHRLSYAINELICNLPIIHNFVEPYHCPDFDFKINKTKETKKEDVNMSSEQFIEKAKKYITDYIIEHIDKSEKIPEFNVFVVWSCFILGYQKALLSTTLPDRMYYEITYNKEKDEMYFDAYKKWENRSIKPDDINE